MDFGTFITGLIAVFFCALPFVFVLRNNQKQKRALQNQLTQLAASNNDQIDYFEQWNHTAMGINRAETAVYYVKSGKQPVQDQLQLDSVESCYVSNDKRIKDGLTNSQRISLNFKLKNNAVVHSWSFYDNLVDPVLPGNEIELAKKWETRLNKKLLR